MIVKCSKNHDDCHNHHQGKDMDDYLDEPLDRAEFEIYDIISSFSLIMFFFSVLVLIMGKCGKRAVRRENVDITHRVLKKSLITMIPLAILCCVMGKHCKHMRHIIHSIEKENGQNDQNEFRGRSLASYGPMGASFNFHRMPHGFDNNMNEMNQRLDSMMRNFEA